MSAASQASEWPSLAYSAPIHHPIYRSSGQAPSIQPQSVQGEVFPNQYQARITYNPPQGFALAQMGTPNPFTAAQLNQTAMSCSPQPTPAGYQRMCQVAAQTGHMTGLQPTAHGYELQAQGTVEVPYGGRHVFVPSIGQYNELSNMSLRQLQFNTIQHEPCIHTLSKLESDVGVLKKQSVQQRLEIKRLEHNCKRKDTTISILKQQMSWKECKMNKLIEDCKKKDIILESLNSERADESKKIETPILNSQESEGHHANNKYLTEKSNDVMMKEIDRLRTENKDVNRLQNKLCKLELDPEVVKRAKAENLSQRRTIASLKQKLQIFDERSGMCSASSSRDLTSCVESSSG